jgi:hypothetical protein
MENKPKRGRWHWILMLIGIALGVALVALCIYRYSVMPISDPMDILIPVYLL